MRHDGPAWEIFNDAMRKFVEEFARVAFAHAPKLVEIPRWVRRYDKYVRERALIHSTSDEANYGAFHFESFRQLRATFYASPLKPYLAGGAASGWTPQIMIDPRDVAIRIANRAATVDAAGLYSLDMSSVETDLRSLHYLVEAKTLRMELIGVILGVQVSETITLRESLNVTPLPASEIDLFLARTPFPMTVNRATQEWEVLIPAPMATLRLTYEQPRNEAVQDHSKALSDDFDCFADAVALHRDARPIMFLQRQWLADEFLRGGWSDSNSIGVGLVEKTATITDASDVIQAFSALRKLRTKTSNTNVSLAIRRLALTRTRGLLDDVLVDVVIALETLLLSKGENEELAFRVSLRAALWGGVLGENPVGVLDLVRRAYALRSQIVHGETPKKDKTHLVDGVPLTYENVVLLVADLSRKFGADALKRILDDNFDMSWDSRLKALLNSAQGA